MARDSACRSSARSRASDATWNRTTTKTEKRSVSGITTTSRHCTMQMEPNDDEDGEESSRAKALPNNLITRLSRADLRRGCGFEGLARPNDLCAQAIRTATSRHCAMQMEPNDDKDGEESSHAKALPKNLITRLSRADLRRGCGFEGLARPNDLCAQAIRTATSRHCAMQMEPNDDKDGEESSHAKALPKNLITRLSRADLRRGSQARVWFEGVVSEALLVPMTCARKRSEPGRTESSTGTERWLTSNGDCSCRRSQARISGEGGEGVVSEALLVPMTCARKRSELITRLSRADLRQGILPRFSSPACIGVRDEQVPPELRPLENLHGSFSVVGFAASLKPDAFDGSNYKRWKARVLLWLTAMQCLFVSRGKMPKPPLSPEEEAKFEAADCLFCGALISVLTDNIVDVYMHMPLGKNMWDALEAKFGLSDAGSELYIMEQFYDYKMVDDHTVMLAKELENNNCELPDKFVAEGIIAKLPPSCSDFATSLKHKRQGFSVTDLIGFLGVEEKGRAKDNRGKVIEGGSTANLVQKTNPHASYNNKKKVKPDVKPKATTNFKKKGKGKAKSDCFVCGRERFLLVDGKRFACELGKYAELLD
uniref:Hypothetcial protein n=1 Tax=Oryza sativa subsp. japonica TaxID=39947 RepID=Q5W6D1_ORYSJ|nr:hypothetcial protein [Oryza sativa Japonica Group]